MSAYSPPAGLPAWKDTEHKPASPTCVETRQRDTSRTGGFGLEVGGGICKVLVPSTFRFLSKKTSSHCLAHYDPGDTYVVVVYLMPVRSSCTDPRRRLWAGSRAWTDARPLPSRQRQQENCSTATPYAMFLQSTGRLSNQDEVSTWKENPEAATSTTNTTVINMILSNRTLPALLFMLISVGQEQMT